MSWYLSQAPVKVMDERQVGVNAFNMSDQIYLDTSTYANKPAGCTVSHCVEKFILCPHFLQILILHLYNLTI